jgi:cell division protein FtsZ
MCFIAAGMGGGTGTGAAPVIAEIARAKGILTVGVVTKPFLFEGTRRMRAAESGIEELQKNVDTLIVIPNQNLFLVAKAETTFKEAFQLADEVLQQGVRSITDLMVMPGLINLDFADVRSVMGEMGKAMMGTGEGEGPNRALEAAERAIANPLLDGVSMQGAKGVIISIIGGEDMKLLEVDEAANHIRELVDPEANIIWGSAFNPDLDGKIRVSVVATGIEQSAEMAQSAASQPLSYGASRAPKKPALPLPTEEELAGDAVSSAPGQPARFDEDPYEAEEADAYSAPPLPETYDLGEEEAEGEDEEGLSEPADDSQFGSNEDGYASLGSMRIDRDAAAAAETDEWGEGGEAEGAAGEEAFELTDEAGQDPAAPPQGGQDELLLDASRLIDADEPVQAASGRRRRMLGSGSGEDEAAPAAPRGAGGGGGALSGSTLFERMANLSRANAGSEDEEEEEEEGGGGSSLRIPRFLGRQNNQ